MMYSCAAASRRPSSIVKKKNKSLIVDLHCHYANAEAAAKVAHLNPAQHEMQIKFANALTRETNKKQVRSARRSSSNIEVRLKDMDKQGIDIQAISPAPQQTYYWTEPKMGAELARQVNERLAEIVGKWPDRLRRPRHRAAAGSGSGRVGIDALREKRSACEASRSTAASTAWT
jgi:hypothetical protein